MGLRGSVLILLNSFEESCSAAAVHFHKIVIIVAELRRSGMIYGAAGGQSKKNSRTVCNCKSYFVWGYADVRNSGVCFCFKVVPEL